MVREHLSAVVGCRTNSNVTQCWATTGIERLCLRKLYTASILYGYFLKSASLRHHLEWGLEMFPIGSKYAVSGHVGGPRPLHVSQVSCSLARKQENLRFYVMGFDSETIQMCAKPKSKEAVNLIASHSSALFGDEEIGLLNIEDVITTSFASLNRFLLEAVAIGSFLWDAENCVNSVYTLEEH